METKVPQTEFIFIIPNYEKFLTGMWKFLHNRKFQIHKAILDDEKLTLRMSVYLFDPECLVFFLRGEVTQEELIRIGSPRFTAYIKKVRRRYKPRVKKLVPNLTPAA